MEEITRAFNALKSETEQATLKAIEWREEALAGLDKTRVGYDEFRAQVEDVYQNMLREAREKDLQSSKHWEDGLKRGFRDVLSEAEDMASQTERLVKNAFKGMEDALVKFVTTASWILNPAIHHCGSGGYNSPHPCHWPMHYRLILFARRAAQAVSSAVIPASRHVNPELSGAHKFHSGGVIGNEVPIIAKRGETVFTPDRCACLGWPSGREPVKVEVNVHNNAAGVQARTETSPLPGGGSRLDIIIEQIEGQMTRNVARGEGLAPTLERRYGLNPAAGSYR